MQFRLYSGEEAQFAGDAGTRLAFDPANAIHPRCSRKS
jgi:hypothetical protein